MSLLDHPDLTLPFIPSPRDAYRYAWDTIRHYRFHLSEQYADRPIARLMLKKPLMFHVPQVFRDRGVIFIHVPKNAGTSVGTALYGMSHGHRPALFYRTINPDFYDRTPSFAIVREPVERTLSSYFFLKNQGGSHVDLSRFWQARARHVTDFDSYLDWVKDLFAAGASVDFIMRRQSDYVTDHDGRVMTSFLFRMDHDQTKLLRFLSQFGVAHLPRLNTTAKESLGVTARQRAIIEDLYAADFALFDHAAKTTFERRGVQRAVPRFNDCLQPS